MDYKFIDNAKLRRLMQKARHKRKVLNNPNKEPEHKNAKINQKYKNVIPIPPNNKKLRKQEKSKLSILKTYVELKIQERKEFIEGDMPSLRGKRKVLKPRSLEGRRLKNPPIKDLAVATKQLSSMIRTGLPLLDALNIISETSENTTISYSFKEIALGISKGSTMSEMLDKYPEVFDEMYRALVNAGETAGLLPNTLDRQAKLLESLAKIKGQIKSAMAYPSAIAILTVVIVFIMMLFVIPIFVDIYDQSGAPLPGITQFLIDLSDQLRSTQFYVKVIPSLIAFYFFFKYFSSRSAFIWWYHKTLLKLPITKDLVTKSCLDNFSRTLSSLNSAGVPILEAITIAKKTLKNRIFTRIIENAYVDIQAGNPMHKAFDKESVIPIMFTSMFRIGEETGELPDMLTRIADNYDEDVDNAVAGMTSLIEPVMIVFLAVAVGFIVIALFLPIVAIIETIGK